MANLTVVYWRDIPAQIIVKAGRKSAKRQLPDRFQEAIDVAAMRSKAHETDAYLEEWRRSTPVVCGDDIEAEADQAFNEMESRFSGDQLNAIARNGGHAVE
jgi:hypothetical protein